MNSPMSVCPGTFAPGGAHLRVSLFLRSSGSNLRGKLRALEGRQVSSKSPSRVGDGDKEIARRNGGEKVFPELSIILKKKTEKIELVGRPAFERSRT